MFFLACYAAHYCQRQSRFTGLRRTREEMEVKLTSNVIQEIGSSSGISVLLTSFNVKASSSKTTVKMAPGGVQVPIIK